MPSAIPLVLLLATSVGLQARAAVWPLPQHAVNGSTTLSVVPGSADAFFVLDGAPCGTLSAAFQRYHDLIFSHHIQQAAAHADFGGTLRSLSVRVDSTSEAVLQLGTDESYELNISSSSTAPAAATLHAATVYGALRGLETFSQMVVLDFDRHSYTLPQAPWAIADNCRFTHRGVMLDTSRHFEPLAAVRRVIESMAYVKLNVLHWHMSDTQSFPFEVISRPKLWQAAHSPQERYLQSDIAEIIEFARLRAVRVMIEFDLPGHAGSWCRGYPQVCPSATCTQPLNVASDATFKLIDDLLGEVTGMKPGQGLFPESLLHLGGDEVNTACWKTTPSIAAWLAARNMTQDDGYGYFVNKTAHLAVSLGRRPVQWNEVWDHFHTKLPKTSIVHVWSDRAAVANATSYGYNVINSQGWYLDQLAYDWAEFYNNDPAFGLEGAQEALVLGGEAPMWGETVDASDLEETLWPRLAAVAENLWSSRNVTSCTPIFNNMSYTPGACPNIDAAFPRLEAFRCLLLRRGVRAAPVKASATKGEAGKYVARSAPPGPGSCEGQ